MRLHRQLPAIYDRKITQRDTQRRHAFYASRLLRGDHAANRDLSAPGDDPAIHYDGLFQSPTEPIALNVSIA